MTYQPGSNDELTTQPHPSEDEWNPEIHLPAQFMVTVDSLDIFQSGDLERLLAGWIIAGMRSEQENDEDWVYSGYENGYPLPLGRLMSVEYVGEDRPKPELGDKAYRIMGEDLVENIEDWMAEEE